MDLEKQHRIVQKGLVVVLAIMAIAVVWYAISVITRMHIDYPDMKLHGWFIFILWFSIGIALAYLFSKRHEKLKAFKKHSLSNPTGQEAFIAYLFFTGILGALTKPYWQSLVLGA